jgi:hypothetical protein
MLLRMAAVMSLSRLRGREGELKGLFTGLSLPLPLPPRLRVYLGGEVADPGEISVLVA